MNARKRSAISVVRFALMPEPVIIEWSTSGLEFRKPRPIARDLIIEITPAAKGGIDLFKRLGKRTSERVICPCAACGSHVHRSLEEFQHPKVPAGQRFDIAKKHGLLVFIGRAASGYIQHRIPKRVKFLVLVGLNGCPRCL
jgi:hypothetical protein